MPDCAPNEAMYTRQGCPYPHWRRNEASAISLVLFDGETKEVWGVVWEVQVVGGLFEVGGEDGEASVEEVVGRGGMGREGWGREGKGREGKEWCRERLSRPGGIEYYNMRAWSFAKGFFAEGCMGLGLYRT